jgi:16S rRNA (cytidine1402-2'-O)-methyltransferase
MEQRAQRSGTTELFMNTLSEHGIIRRLKANLQPGTLLCIGAAFGWANSWVTTRSIQAWKSHSPQLHKIPCVFALNRSH